MIETFAARKDGMALRLTRLRGAVSSALRLTLDIALPQPCPTCREPLGDGAGLCAACWAKLSIIEPPYCARLGTPFAYDAGPGLLSMEAIADPPAYDRARGGALRRHRPRAGACL